jgi:hypothetical protein
MYPLIYEDYPLAGIGKITWRNQHPIGIPPEGEIQIWQQNYDRILGTEEENSGQVAPWASFAHIMYLLPYYWSLDYSDVRNQCANAYISGHNPGARVEKILGRFCWPVIGAGSYPVKLEYFLPGKPQPTTTLTLMLQNPFDFPQPEF